jgi:putative transposase
LNLPRSSYYYAPTGTSSEDLALMRLIDEQYLRTPFFGTRQMSYWLQRNGHAVNRKRVQRLMRCMGLQATAPGPHTSKPHPRHPVYPYLLGHMVIDRPNLVWSTDITYIPMQRGFQYLVAVIDWYSRYVLSWRLSNTLDVDFCIDALRAALACAHPVVFNTDQGAQFTSDVFLRELKDREILISMDGRGRALDNAFIERLWRSVKYEDIYLRDYADGHQLHCGLSQYFAFYNHHRPHSAHGGDTPAQAHGGSAGACRQASIRRTPCG